MKVFTANGFLYAAKVAAAEHRQRDQGWTEEEIVAGMADFLAKLPPSELEFICDATHAALLQQRAEAVVALAAAG